jgi:hypothetical protein
MAWLVAKSVALFLLIEKYAKDAALVLKWKAII